jgi:hypothetical protein
MVLSSYVRRDSGVEVRLKHLDRQRFRQQQRLRVCNVYKFHQIRYPESQ